MARLKPGPSPFLPALSIFDRSSIITQVLY
jgi:hypothetical protein